MPPTKKKANVSLPTPAVSDSVTVSSDASSPNDALLHQVALVILTITDHVVFQGVRPMQPKGIGRSAPSAFEVAQCKVVLARETRAHQSSNSVWVLDMTHSVLAQTPMNRKSIKLIKLQGWASQGNWPAGLTRIGGGVH